MRPTFCTKKIRHTWVQSISAAKRYHYRSGGERLYFFSFSYGICHHRVMEKLPSIMEQRGGRRRKSGKVVGCSIQLTGLFSVCTRFRKLDKSWERAPLFFSPSDMRVQINYCPARTWLYCSDFICFFCPQYASKSVFLLF